MCQAALQYARRGWKVFPCRERDETIQIRGADGPRDKVLTAKAPYTGQGLKNATTDETTIRGWWARWPTAMIGLPMGENAMFALDFDPRTDAATGEVFTLVDLKAATEAQIGCALPTTLASVTQSGGVHALYAQPEGEPIRNRGNLPPHVDVRGQGGYIVAPPSILYAADGAERRYRWIEGRQDTVAVAAPAALIAVLRAPKASPSKNAGGDQPPTAFAMPRAGGDSGHGAVADAVRKYALAALDGEIGALIATPMGDRNNAINARSFSLGQLVGAGALGETLVRGLLQQAVATFGRDYDKCCQAIESGLTAGMTQPRDLRAIEDKARARGDRPPPRSGAAPGPRSDGEGKPSFRVEGSGASDRSGGAGGDADAVEARHKRCLFRPHTDLGNAERFVERYGDDFRWSPALGWMGWDGRRWVMLVQEEKKLPPEVSAAVVATVRAIQDEAALIAASGMEDDDSNPDGLDQLIWVSDKKSTTRAAIHAKWGRSSEASGKLGCIAQIAQHKLAVAGDAFDADPLTINLLNGTLRLSRAMVGGAWQARWTLRPHDRADLISKLAPVTFDRDAACPIYDATLAWAQKKATMRRYLHQWGGLSMTGDMGEQKLHFWYGLGGNGKSTIMDVWCHVLGDYTTTVPIETFLDQGVKRRGDQATPELARLGGVRLLRTSEPERGAKIAAALIKLVTGGEPMSVRFLHRGFFDLRPIFKMTIQGNFRPEIPDTDEGIWRRVKLVPWPENIDKEPPNADGSPKKDPALPRKLQAEASGILNRLVDGVLDWLKHGLIEPSEVTQATQQYRTESDPLARFLTLCTRPEPSGRVQSSHLHQLFAAWCKAAGEREWSQRGFSKAMADKGFVKKQSDGMWWLGFVETRTIADFVDHNGQPVPFSLPDDATPGPAPPAPPDRVYDDDDDVV